MIKTVAGFFLRWLRRLIFILTDFINVILWRRTLVYFRIQNKKNRTQEMFCHQSKFQLCIFCKQRQCSGFLIFTSVIVHFLIQFQYRLLCPAFSSRGRRFLQQRAPWAEQGEEGAMRASAELKTVSLLGFWLVSLPGDCHGDRGLIPPTSLDLSLPTSWCV